MLGMLGDNIDAGIGQSTYFEGISPTNPSILPTKSEDINLRAELPNEVSVDRQYIASERKTSTSFNNGLLSKQERENLFNEAQRKYAEGLKEESALMFMKCLGELDVNTAFPSLPKCLRALANHFLEQEEYVKSIHFVQAERLYYESALLDIAALQKKLTEMSGGYICDQEVPYTNSTGCMNGSANEKPPRTSRTRTEPYEDNYVEIKKQLTDTRRLSRDGASMATSNEVRLSHLTNGSDVCVTANGRRTGCEQEDLCEEISVKKKCDYHENQHGAHRKPSALARKLTSITEAIDAQQENMRQLLIYCIYGFGVFTAAFIVFSVIFTLIFGRVQDESLSTNKDQNMFNYMSKSASKEPPRSFLYRWMLNGVQAVQVLIYLVTGLFWRISRSFFWLIGLTPQDSYEIDIGDLDSRPVWLT